MLIVGLAFSSQLGAKTIDLKTFGARGDGHTVETALVQKAVDAVAEAGGGRVVFSGGGTFVTGTIALKSNVELHLEAGATWLGSPSMADYAVARPHLLAAVGIRNVALTGLGTINGNGATFWTPEFEPLDRPLRWLYFADCENVKIKDLTLVESPSHVIVLLRSQFCEVAGITVRNHPRSPNTDGIDVTDSREVFIANCYLESGDDLICIKSHERMVENVAVTNCTLISDDAAIKFGTGGTVGARFCTFSNLIIRNTRYGLAFFQMDGGVYENILFQNILIETGGRNRNRYPIFMDIDKRQLAGRLGSIANIQFQGINIFTDGNCLLAGQPGAPLQNIQLKDVTMTLTGINDVSGFRKPRGNKTLPHFPDMQDLSSVAAHFTLGYIEGLHWENVKIRYAPGVSNQGQRKDFELIEVNGLERR